MAKRTSNNPAGRTPYPPAQRRSARVTVRFTPAELDALKARAAAEGQSLPDYIRSRLDQLALPWRDA